MQHRHTLRCGGDPALRQRSATERATIRVVAPVRGRAGARWRGPCTAAPRPSVVKGADMRHRPIPMGQAATMRSRRARRRGAAGFSGGGSTSGPLTRCGWAWSRMACRRVCRRVSSLAPSRGYGLTPPTVAPPPRRATPASTRCREGRCAQHGSPVGVRPVCRARAAWIAAGNGLRG